MYDLDGGEVASTIYYGLFPLQHRGQKSCGIAVSDTEGPKGKVSAYILVSESCAPDTVGAEFVRDVEPVQALHQDYLE